MDKRKNIRLPDFDYSVGTYFVTVCAKDRNCIFRCVGAANSRPWELTQCGKFVENAIKAIPEHYPNITLGHYVVMPNHIHILLTLNEPAQGRLIAAPYPVDSDRSNETVVLQRNGCVHLAKVVL